MSAAQTVIESIPLGAGAAYWKERIRSARALALFLSFDGTLSPRAEQAVIDPQAKSIIDRLHRLGGIQIAIISDRHINDLRSRAGVEGIIYAGNNGLEIETDTVCFREPHAENFRLEFRRLALRLQQLLSDATGVAIETKGLGLAIHYREVHESLQGWVRGLISEAVCRLPMFTCVEGDQAIEVRPAVEWNNGNAVRWLLEYHAPVGAYPIYIGSDTTDEDAFNALNPDALTIHVGAPAGTLARFHVDDVAAVRSFLASIYELRSQEKR